jgi:hypothetical protein
LLPAQAGQLEKAGLAPAFFIACFGRRRFPSAGLFVPPPAISAWLQAEPKQTVDGFLRALEIVTRSSYVPSAPIGVHSGS